MKLEIEMVQLFEAHHVRVSFNQDATDMGSKVRLCHFDPRTARYVVSSPDNSPGAFSSGETVRSGLPEAWYDDEGTRLPGIPLPPGDEL